MSIKDDQLLADFNSASTLLILSSFPEAGREVAADNAVARYTHLLAQNFPQKQKVVIVSERRSATEIPYLLSPTVLVVPSYKPNSLSLLKDISQTIASFSQVSHILVQHEMSVFGNQVITFGMTALLATLKAQGKHVSIMLHQVVTDITDLAGHVGVKPNSLKAKALNVALKSFYKAIGASVEQILVHDSLLKQKLQALLPNAQIAVIPHGILPEPIMTTAERNQARKGLGYTSKERVILAYGYQSWYKGTDWVIEAVSEYARANPTQNIRLLVAGSSSPTQKNSAAYQAFSARLHELIKDNKTLVKTLGFVPEKKVRQVFAAADVVVFPYRARMSASGALSLAWQYHKPFMVSQPVAENLKEKDAQAVLRKQGVSTSQVSFKLTQASFNQALRTLLADKDLQKKVSTVGKNLTQVRSWSTVARSYLSYCVPTSPISRNRVNKLSSLSVFFPMHNEQDNVERVIKHTLAHLPKVAHKFEIIIVNDGSQDQTSSRARKLAKAHRTVKVIDQPNLGYGGALQTGFANAKYEWVFFSDGDLQFDLSELKLFVPHTKDSRVVIGYRKHRADSPKRILLATLLKIWNWIFFQFPTHIKDTDCAFKLFHRSVIADIFPLQSRGAMISTELLLKITDQEYALSQVGVTHYPRLFGEQTGAQAHVIMGAIKETAKLFYQRSLEPVLVTTSTYRWTSLPAALVLFLYSVIQPKN